MFRFARCLSILAFVAVVSLPKVSFAYDLKRTSLGHQIRWTQSQIALRIDPRLEQMLGGEQFRAAAVMASESWRGLPGVPDITIEQGAPNAYSEQHRGNGIYLMEEWPFESNQLAVTRVTFAQTGEVVGVDVLVNGSKRFAMFREGAATVITDRYDMASVLTHEFGHVLGLDESHDHPEATMWPQIHMGESRQRVLSQDDEEGVIEAYQAEAPKANERAAGCSVTAPHAGNGGLGGLVLLSGIGLVFARANRKRIAA